MGTRRGVPGCRPTSTDRITLTGSQHRELTRMTRAGRTEQRLVHAGRDRARGRCGRVATPRSPGGWGSARTPSASGVTAGARHRVRRRWPMRSDRVADRSSPPVQVARVKAMACTPPRDTGLPLSRWSCPELAEQAITDGICGSISPSTIRRWLSAGRAQTVAVPVVDLHHATPTSPPRRTGCWTSTPARGTATPLAADDYVISADEKTSIQARCRCHPTLPPGTGPARCGSTTTTTAAARVAYLAAYDVHRATVFGRCAATTGIDPFTDPGRPGHDPRALRLSRPGVLDRRQRLLPPRQAAIDRLAEHYPNAIMVHTPVHASWLNQIEIYFSIVQRKVLITQRLHRPRPRRRTPHPPSRTATTRPRSRSNGSSPPPT